MNKIAEPEEVAIQVAFLASHRVAGHTTGQVVMIHGGMEGTFPFLSSGVRRGGADSALIVREVVECKAMIRWVNIVTCCIDWGSSCFQIVAWSSLIPSCEPRYRSNKVHRKSKIVQIRDEIQLVLPRTHPPNPSNTSSVFIPSQRARARADAS